MAEKDQTTRLDDTIRSEQLKLVFAQAPLAIIISPVAATTLAIGIWQVADHGAAIVWVLVIASIALFRIGLVVAFKRQQSALAMGVWERLFAYSFILAGLCWGVGGWLLLPEEFAYRAMIFFFLIGMASAAVAVYSLHVWAVMLTILGLVLPATLDFALQDSMPERLMAVAAVLFMIVAYRSLRITNHFVQRSQSLSYELQRAKEHAETLARTDFLTGMNNRRSFYDLCETPFRLARRHGQDLAVILFDIDRFKEINDAHGHAVGDEVIRSLARIVASTGRESDIAGRVGGEEFAILLPQTNARDAQELAERLRERVEQSVVHLDHGEVQFTASFGVVQMGSGCESLEALVAAADGAMYRAKERGKNFVFVVTPPAPEDATL
jgi:diguanylate cyclase (GGDEF)-like protein